MKLRFSRSSRAIVQAGERASADCAKRGALRILLRLQECKAVAQTTVKAAALLRVRPAAVQSVQGKHEQLFAVDSFTRATVANPCRHA